MVFRSGTDSLTTLMHQDRHGNIGGLCDALPLVFSGAAISLVMDLGLEMERLEREKTERSVAAPPPPPGASRRSAALEASQEFMLDNCGFKHLTKVSTRLADIASLVTVLVPLSLANSSLAEEFKRTLQALSALSAFREAVPTATNFTALVHLSSEGSAGNGRQGAVGTDRAQQKRRSSREKPVWLPSVDVTALAAAKSLSQSTLAKRRHDLFNPDSKDLPLSKPENSVRETMTAAKERLNDLNRKTEHWAIDGGAVIVKCPVYVWSTVAVCGILVLGGFMIGFFVGERIPGVDPFGIASFTWVLAGFIILIAKSVRVSEWSWRDFLLGRVTCRSVTELHTVTRLDAQDIIMYLLSTRHRNLLGTCGPFNTPFREKNPGGFSIDVKIELQTLWACGIIPLQVTTLEGPNLVLLDLTRGQKGLMKADHSTEGYAENDNYIAVCRDLPPADDGRDAPLVLFESVSWIKIVGIYDCLERKFR
ncbi:hypothetical protein F5883DRAFT_531047 [Diaporthe sp. PMI_573]|nr:hypothetical protein F5883DRAFT_531047 [Diaporthaceae sp. PMI_573]